LVADLEKLPQAFPRRFLPRDLPFNWEAISGVFEDLRTRSLHSPADLERWLRDEDELNAYLYEQRSIRYINSTRQTDNPDFTGAYESYVNELEPKLKVSSFDLLKLYCASMYRAGLPEKYRLEDKRRQTALGVFRVENVELEKQDAQLAQKYQKTRAAMTVNFRGEERTLQQMAKFLEEANRGVREEAWRLADLRSLQDKGSLDDVYTQMVALRAQAAHNAGYDSYEDYIFVKKARFDYTTRDCMDFHSAVEEYMVPLSREVDRLRKDRLGVERLMPWDMIVDPEGRKPLTPFQDISGLVGGAGRVVSQIDGELASYFARMVELGVLDLDSRKGKAPGGYQEELSERRIPFIFMNAAKRDNDVRILLHEAGHSFHTFLMRDQKLPFFNSNANMPLEFAEVASMSMEIVSGEHYDGVFYDREQAKRSNFDEAVSNVKLFTWVATIDAFQQWVYSHPDHSLEERRAAWLGTFARFGGLESYDGLDDSRTYRWQRQLHLFEAPFYYIEYGIALTGALGVWSRYRKDRKDSIDAYKDALSIGATRPLPDLFRAAGLQWGFGGNAIGTLASELRSAIREYS
jgi:oligoendopeptidase F